MRKCARHGGVRWQGESTGRANRLLAVALLLAGCASPRPGSPAAAEDAAPGPAGADGPSGAERDGGTPAVQDGRADTPPSSERPPTDVAPPPAGPDAPPGPDAVPGQPLPPAEPPGSDRPLLATRVAAGAGHTCALHENGTVRCWGDNSHGQLGRPASMTPLTRPLSVLGLTGARAIAAGAHHTCAIVGDGSVQCWGWNVNGQLGTGTLTDAAWPDAARKAVGVAGATAISARGPHTCAVVTGGRVMCWGGVSAGGDWTMPAAIAGLDGASAISVGDLHRCVVKAGSALCWGSNDDGQLGDGTQTSSAVPVAVRGLTGVTAIDAGAERTCAIAGGSLYCWGVFVPVATRAPVDLTPLRAPEITAGSAVTEGRYHGCALAAGRLWCWGIGFGGLLGNGSEDSQPVPAPVGGLDGVTAAAAGEQHTCAVVSGGAVRCWGYNRHGQLGNGRSGGDAGALSPAPVVD